MMPQGPRRTENTLTSGAARRHGWLRWQIDFLGSGRLAIVLLAVLVFLLFLYLFIPQWEPWEADQLEAWARERGLAAQLARILDLTSIRRSWWLYGTFALLFVNLLLCMVRRFRAAVLLARFPERPPPTYPKWPFRELPGKRLATEQIARFLAGKGYRTLRAEDAVYGLRGRFAVVGHWLFHVSLLLLLGVGAFVVARPTPFRGTIGLGEGEAFDLHLSPFLSTNTPPSPQLPGLRFQIQKIDVVTEGNTVRKFDIEVTTPTGGGSTIGINRPYRSRHYQVMAHGFGYMPGWVIVSQRGRMLNGAWVKLVPFPMDMEERFPIGPENSEVRVRFFPDHETDENGEQNRSHELRNPRFRTRIKVSGKKIFEGLLKPDERVPLGDGREFFFLPEIRRYAALDVIREREHGVIFAGFGVMILGLALRYVRLRKEIVVASVGGSLRMYGHCEILEHLFEEELDGLAQELGGADPGTVARREEL